MDRDITQDFVSAASQKLKEDRSVVIARNATTSAGIKAAAKNPLPYRIYHDTYSVSLNPTGTITNQKKSGRCWMFAGYNVLRDRVMSNLGVKQFELSQSYGQFWDKLEKANLFLEEMIKLADKPLDDRLVRFWMDDPISDGGWWEMVAAEATKYGVVPKDAMPETAVSSNTADMNEVLSRKLREDALDLRKAHAAGTSIEDLRSSKEDMLDEVYRILVTCLGEPPTTFTLEYVADADKDKDKDADKDEQKQDDAAKAKLTAAERKSKEAQVEGFTRVSNLTPKEFFDRYVGIDFDNYVGLSNLPGEGRPYGRILEMDYVIPTVGTPVRTLNEPIEVLKQAAIASLRDGHPVWFACDVLKNLYRSDGQGLLDTETVDTQSLFGITYGMDKAEQLDTRELQINHAMTLQGVNLDDDGNPIAWRVENSWGKDACKDGYLIISDRWMDAFLGQVIVDKQYLPEDIVRAWESPAEPAIKLDPWAPMIGLSD